MRCRVALLGLILASCGGGYSPPSSPTPPQPSGPTITISSGGVVSPNDLAVSQGTRVLFVNNDSRRHDMTSDPHPEHDDCREINNVGPLTPGQSRETGNLNDIRSCGFHDHDNPDNSNLRGRITIR